MNSAPSQLTPWLPEFVKLAQQYSALFLRLYTDGTHIATILEVSPVRLASMQPHVWTTAIVSVGTLTLLAVNDRVEYTRIDGELFRTGKSVAHYNPVDGVPWEIHALAESSWDAYVSAREAFLESNQRLNE